MKEFAEDAVSKPVGDYGRTVILSLVDALHTEARLLRELATVVARQRAALSASDVSALEDNVYTIHRVLHTWAAARTRRKSINRILGESEELTFGELELALGSAMTPDVRAACQDLAEAARELGERLDHTRAALQSVISPEGVPIRTEAMPTSDWQAGSPPCG